jgi:23S rRNA (cytosine1962-C5)-methyltransferase
MAARRDAVAAALAAASGARSGFERADGSAARREGIPARQGVLWGPPPEVPLEVRERGRRYRVDLLEGQKTGFYLDQRDARDLVELLARGRRVLDVFAYTGGFSVAAAVGGAAALTLVESSAAALALAAENLALCGRGDAARLVQADAFRFLRHDDGGYDLVVLDPPPLARQRRDVARATRGYKDLLLHGLRRAAPGARVLCFACSHHVDAALFRRIAFAAALDAGRSLRVLRVLGQPADHPVALDHPEGAYLSGLLLET